GVFILEKKRESDGGLPDAAPHFHGHRARLRGRFRDAGAEALSDYELSELLLFRALPRRDVKPLAKTLLAKFGSFAEVIASAEARAAAGRRGERERGPGGAGLTKGRVGGGGAGGLRGAPKKTRPGWPAWPSVPISCRPARGSPVRERLGVFSPDRPILFIP